MREKETMLVATGSFISPFPTMFSEADFLWIIKTYNLFGTGLNSRITSSKSEYIKKKQNYTHFHKLFINPIVFLREPIYSTFYPYTLKKNSKKNKTSSIGPKSYNNNEFYSIHVTYDQTVKIQ